VKYLLSFALCLTAACSSATQGELQQVAIASYAGQQLSCVQLATTKAQADVCRAVVWAHYCSDGGILGEAGVCEVQSYNVKLDGGAQ
jgi:hypothetical protein